MISVWPLLGIALAAILVVAALVAVYVMWEAGDRAPAPDGGDGPHVVGEPHAGHEPVAIPATYRGLDRKDTSRG